MSQVGWTTVTACLQDYLMNLQISYNQYSARRSAWGSSIKYVTLFLTNFDTPSPLSRIAEPPKVRHIPEPPKITQLQYAFLNFVRNALISIESQLYCIVL